MKNDPERSRAEILRQKAEARKTRKPPTIASPLSEADARKLLHELEVHQIELEMQNEELMRAQSAASDIAEKYIELYDHSPSGYVTLAADGKVHQLNFACARMLGKERSRVMNNAFRYLVTNETRPAFDLFVQKVFESRGPAACEAALSAGEGSPVSVHLTGIISKDEQLILITVTDITERKRSEAELRRLYEQTRHDAAVKADLLNEVNHRVKNNLMMILGLILAEERRAAAGGQHHMVAVWDKFESRINGLLHVHQMLSDSHWAPVNLDQLAERICGGAIRSSGTAGVPIDLHIGNSGVTVSPRQAGNLALVFNELVINCMKYAFNDTNAASLRVSNTMEGDRICIEFRDNGSGYPERVLNREDWNVGLRLIDQLIEGTLGGKILLTNHNGAVTRIVLGSEGK